jgi:hypothetical protein
MEGDDYVQRRSDVKLYRIFRHFVWTIPGSWTWNASLG